MIHPAPKPARAAPKQAKPLQRTKPLPRTSHVKPVNRKRRASEFQRTYHSKARVEWVKSLSCCVRFYLDACDGPVENAHTVNGGKSRKGDYDTIVPLCAKHHRDLDRHEGYFSETQFRQLVKQTARGTQLRWQAHEALTIAPPRAEHGK